jgi:hypothetical protein
METAPTLCIICVMQPAAQAPLSFVCRRTAVNGGEHKQVWLNYPEVTNVHRVDNEVAATKSIVCFGSEHSVACREINPNAESTVRAICRCGLTGTMLRSWGGGGGGAATRRSRNTKPAGASPSKRVVRPHARHAAPEPIGEPRLRTTVNIPRCGPFYGCRNKLSACP